jgi:hypothetical protein
MQAAAAEVLLELSAASRAAGQHLHRRLRARLEAAVAAVLIQHKTAREAAANPTAQQALDRLRAALDLCRDAGVPWPDVVAAVNHEEGF